MKKLLNTAFRLGKLGDSSELTSLCKMFPHMAEDLKVEFRLGQNHRQHQPLRFGANSNKRNT